MCSAFNEANVSCMLSKTDPLQEVVMNLSYWSLVGTALGQTPNPILIENTVLNILVHANSLRDKVYQERFQYM